MPYKLVWVEPTLFLEHKGVCVYHAYKSGRDHPMRFWFSLSPERDAGQFDVRELSTWPKGLRGIAELDADRKSALIAAIDSGEIHRVKTIRGED